MVAKPVTALTAEDLVRFPVWEYDLGHEGVPGRDETWVVPVKRLPVDELTNRLVATSLRLRNGQTAPGFLGNVALQDAPSTRESRTASVWLHGRWFHLARYFDVGVAEHGPAALAAALGLPVEAVFPIGYDIAGAATGLAAVVRGESVAEPTTRLSAAQRMDLLFGR